MAFFSEIRVFIAIFIMFGLWSCWPNFKYYKFLRAYTICLSLQELSVFLTMMFSFRVFSEDTLSSVVANWLCLIVSLTHFTIVFESLLKRKDQMKLIQKFTSIDNLYNTKLKVNIPYRKEKRGIILRNVCFILIFIMTKVAISTYLYYRNEMSILWYPALYSIWIMCLRSIQVMFFLYLIRGRLKLINELLKDLERAINSKQHRRKLFSPNSIYNQILGLKSIFAKLYEICRLINKIFSWSLLAIITQCFVDFTFNCYWAFLYLENSAFDDANVVSCIGLLLAIVTLLTILTFYSSSCFYHVSTIN